MKFKTLLTSAVLLTIPLAYAQGSHAKESRAQLDLPLDLIELLGEMDDNDSMLEVALSEVEPIPGSVQQHHESTQIKKQNSPVGGDKK